MKGEGAKANDLITSSTVEGTTVIGFRRGGIRDEREILKTLGSLARYLESHHGLKFLLDLGHVSYMTSAGLGCLVGLLKKVRTGGGNLKLCCLRDSVRELFQVTRLDQIFEIHTTVEAAVESFRPVPQPEATP